MLGSNVHRCSAGSWVCAQSLLLSDPKHSHGPLSQVLYRLTHPYCTQQTVTDELHKRLLLDDTDVGLDSLASLDDAQILQLEEMYRAAAAEEVGSSLPPAAKSPRAHGLWTGQV